MAERRMFAKTIIDSDVFLDMPLSTQALYFHLAMRADDDGFVNNPKKLQRMVNCSDDDYRILCAKRYIIPFESGVCVIKHWLIHNLIRCDRYKPTVYQEEKATLTVKATRAYTEKKIPASTERDTVWQPNGNQMATQVRLGKVSQGEVSLGQSITTDEPPPFITQEEADTMQADIDTIRREAQRCGLPITDKGMDDALSLKDAHGMDKLLEAIRKTGEQTKDKWRWVYVKGVLEGNGKPSSGNLFADMLKGGTT